MSMLLIVLIVVLSLGVGTLIGVKALVWYTIKKSCEDGYCEWSDKVHVEIITGKRMQNGKITGND